MGDFFQVDLLNLSPLIGQFAKFSPLYRQIYLRQRPGSSTFAYF